MFGISDKKIIALYDAIVTKANTAQSDDGVCLDYGLSKKHKEEAREAVVLQDKGQAYRSLTLVDRDLDRNIANA